MTDERPLSDRMRTAIDVAASWNDRTMNFEMVCDWVAEVAALEAEVGELRQLRDLVTEAQSVTFTNDSPRNEYPLQVWSHSAPFGVHPFTWGVRGECVTREDIERALRSLRAEEAIGAEKGGQRR